MAQPDRYDAASKTVIVPFGEIVRGGGISGFPSAHAHPELSPDGGMTEYVDYVQSTGAFGRALPLVKVVFGQVQASRRD